MQAQTRNKGLGASGPVFRKWGRRGLIAYVVLALGGLIAPEISGTLGVRPTPHREIFPVFSWFLFPLTPNPSVQYGVRITEVDGVPVSGEPLFQKMPAGGAIYQPGSITAFENIQNLGHAWQAGDLREVERLRTLLETSFFRGVSGYALVGLEFDPRERLFDEEAVSETRLAEFVAAREGAEP